MSDNDSAKEVDFYVYGSLVGSKPNKIIARLLRQLADKMDTKEKPVGAWSQSPWGEDVENLASGATLAACDVNASLALSGGKQKQHPLLPIVTLAVGQLMFDKGGRDRRLAFKFREDKEIVLVTAQVLTDQRAEVIEKTLPVGTTALVPPAGVAIGRPGPQGELVLERWKE